MQLKADQIVQRDLLESERKRSAQLSDECKQLRAKLMASIQKRSRQEPCAAPAPMEPESVENPPKRHSPPDSVGLGPITNFFKQSGSNKVLFPSPKPKTPTLATASVPSKKAAATRPLKDLTHLGVFPLAFRGLSSLVCSDYDPTSDITVGEGNLTYDIAIDMIKEEVAEIPKWSEQVKRMRHPMIVSALALIYPDQITDLMKRSFIKSAHKITDYWIDVLNKFKKAWSVKAAEAAKEAKFLAITSQLTVKSVEDRIQERINALSAIKPAVSPETATYQPAPFASSAAAPSVPPPSGPPSSKRVVIDMVSPNKKASTCVR